MIEVMYSCSECEAVDRPVEVMDRRSYEGIMGFMHRVQMAVFKNHKKHSPACAARSIQDLKIPVAGGQPIGKKVNPHGE